MIAVLNFTSTPPTLLQLQASFQQILPRIERHAELSFRGIKCRDTRTDCVAETVALCWRWFKDLSLRGKDPTCFPSALAGFAVRAVRSGRRLCGQLRAGDVFNRATQQRKGYRVEPLPIATRRCMNDLNSPDGQGQLDAYEERLQDNRQTPIPDQVAFRCDFPRWLQSQTYRHSRMIRDMIREERTMDLANKYGVTPGRISQLRCQFRDDWERFCADAADPKQTA
jgi:hypothetical protein